jgi:photosystem II stability/assembly factor-like uncharacterized protein
MKEPCTKLRARTWAVSAAVGLLSVTISTSKASPIYYWYNIGPQPINWFDGKQNLIEQDCGRVPVVAVDPGSSNHWLIGAAQGGVWETFDAGNNWIPRTDDQASLAMGAIAFAPDNPSRVYAGTGEANFRGDAYAGAGLLVSDDGGSSWRMVNTNFAKTSFSRIVVNPADSKNLSVATARGTAGVGEEASGHGNIPGAPPRGVFISTDGGTNFTRGLTGEVTALEANPQNFCQQYAGAGEIYGDPTNGVYRTTNCWQSAQLILGPWGTNVTYIWTNYIIGTNTMVNCDTNLGSGGGSGTNCFTNSFPVYTNYIIATNFTSLPAPGRIAMALAPSDPNVLYVGVAEPRTNYLADLRGIWMTTNAWADSPTWTQVSDPFEVHFGPDYNVSTPRFWYMFDLLVDPNDPAVIYLAEFNVWRYASGYWESLADWSATGVHPDHHAMAWVPRGNQTYQLLLGNDGGVYISDRGVTGYWTNLNSRLRITEFYKGAVDATGQHVLKLGGAQDEFTSEYTGSAAWKLQLGGDGADCSISTTDPLNDWSACFTTITDNHSTPNKVALFRTRDGGVSGFDFVTNGINDALPFSEQFLIHHEKAPYNDDLVLAGTARLWRCDDFFSGSAPTWSANSPTVADAAGVAVPISAIAFAPSDTNGMIYAFGSEDGQLFITPNGGGNWNPLNSSGAIPGRYVSGLAFSPTDSNTLYVSLSGFDETIPGQPGHLFKTSNALTAAPTWTDVSPPVDLPNNCVAVNPLNADEIFVGTDIGIWHSTTGGSSWAHYTPADGLPNVAVYDLRFTANGQLTAFTHGRGAFVLTVKNFPILVWFEPNFHPTPNCLTCPPDRLWINPGDEVSMEIALQGILPVDTVDLQATLQPAPQITPISGTQDYGVVTGQGPPVSRTFKFIAGAGPGASPVGCGAAMQLTLQLADQGTSLGQITIPFRLGVPSHPLVEDFEEQPPPALSPGWASANIGATPLWMTTTDSPPAVPSESEDELHAPEIINTCAFVPDAGSGQSSLVSPPFTVATSQAQLNFREAFSVANLLDGGVLEIAIGSQPFEDILQAGGSFVKDGYNVMLSDRNPLGPRAAWSGNSGGWLPVIVNLPPGAAGQSVQLRWRFGAASGTTNGAWFVDSVIVTEPLCLPPITNPLILNPKLSGNQFSFAIDTASNRTYTIQFKTNLTDSAWQTLETLSGNDSQQTVNVPINPSSQQFYRFIVQ